MSYKKVKPGDIVKCCLNNREDNYGIFEVVSFAYGLDNCGSLYNDLVVCKPLSVKIYHENLFVLPYDRFEKKVNKKIYPNITQEYEYERVSDENEIAKILELYNSKNQ